MKLTTDGQYLTVTSENSQESVSIISFMEAFGRMNGASNEVVTRKKHKKHQFTKKCENCGRGFKGNYGIAAHHRRNPMCRTPIRFQGKHELSTIG